MKHSQLRVSYLPKIFSAPIISTADSYNFLIRIWDKGTLNLQEQVYVLYLNNKNEVIGWRCLNTGNSNYTLFNVQLAISIGLICMASKIIVAHNHPSGLLKASEADISITKQLKKAATFMDMKLADHMIISRDGYFSFLDHRLLKSSGIIVPGLFFINKFISPLYLLMILG